MYTEDPDITRTCRDHEFMLSFDNDSDCVLFHEWWWEVGSSLFMKWYENKEEIKE